MITIAFIGVGNMGLPMLDNLLRTEAIVQVFDINEKARESAKKLGARAFDSIHKAVAGADVVISMLPAGEQVRQVYLGEDGHVGMMGELSTNTLLIDCSTTDPETAKLVGEYAKKSHMRFVDAPVSGGIAGAKAGSLTFIVGGSNEDFMSAKAILSAMGGHIYHAGGVGDGQLTKICNNLILGSVMAATCEGLALGKSLGLDPKVLSDIVQQSSGTNWVLEKYNPCPGVSDGVPSASDYSRGFMTRLMVKDLKLAIEACESSPLANVQQAPMTTQALALFSMHLSQLHQDLDFSSLYQFYASSKEMKDED
ncbi:3-hydroxyisobutyrate dehydrogenase [Thaumasiovibrio subtropicus]|uniref:3-hydroxyisobutyrate dehydrogenase n=1 Tax=Thaumasiovibrio subtropicus TaxID=1891207 RepID=UPI000B35AB69|nr:3-hydroxyisobutyrate dehydrogenase [Thaumasiovibrio subtropicus]